jgi:DNA invertase Pin-like site-specific DNA recombinase
MAEANMTKRAAIYCRVSTEAQCPQNQETELREVATRAGWQVFAVYTDHGVSGSKGRKDRPALNRMLRDAARRKFDLIAVSTVDRLGRSLADLLQILGDVHAARIDIFIRREALDTTSPTGKAAFSLMGIFAEFERNLIRQRVLAGLARARAEGRVLGRLRMAEEKTRAIRAALAAGGASLRQIAAQYRVGLGSVQRVKASMPSLRTTYRPWGGL